MRKATEAISTAMHMLAEQNTYAHAYTAPFPYCYLYGAKGEKITTRAQVENYFRMEPSYYARYSAAEKEQIIKNSIGRIAYDCSGFVGTCTWDHQYSGGQIANAHDIQTTAAGMSSNPAGSILFTTYGGRGRHIGIDVDHGWCCDMAYESTDANVRSGKAGIRLYRINQDGYNMRWTPWEKSGMSNVLQY